MWIYILILLILIPVFANNKEGFEGRREGYGDDGDYETVKSNLDAIEQSITQNEKSIKEIMKKLKKIGDNLPDVPKEASPENMTYETPSSLH